ncbi:hypothetical protein [Flagellimonas meishanensis]|nr:hypothetical protein [[Muricauda] meishanensis]
MDLPWKGIGLTGSSTNGWIYGGAKPHGVQLDGQTVDDGLEDAPIFRATG